MRTKSINYWMNKLQNSDLEARDENELSFKKIAEYFISREKKKKVAA